ncbi:MAG: type 1 glutamine amidotransferase [Solirubrobacteraceae bacterium]|jgi:GMP synthase (glutamine-hydrolysing)|nr:type 1 glutamine amidotransferase [Solirubrobacteraceae bacterium]
MKLVVVQHLFCESPGAYDIELDRRGVQREVVEIDTGDKLPDWNQFDGIIAMGGPMSVNDEAEHPWLVDEKRWVAEAVRAGKPFFGACLGVQLLASALGAPVYPLAQAEVGLLPVIRTQEGVVDAVVGGLAEPLVTLQWHGDTFDLPEGGVLLASSPAAPNQAFRYGDAAYGIQFHLEVTPEMAEQWSAVPEYSAALTATLGEEGGKAFLADAVARHEELGGQAQQLIGSWLDLIDARSGQ